MVEQTVELQPGESKTVSFEVTPTVAKTYSVSVDGLTGTFRAIEALANLYGVVTDADTGLPLSGVKVTLKGQIAQTYTKTDGSYRFEGLTPDPNFAVFFEKDGYDTEGKMLALTEGDNILNVEMAPTVVPGADIRIENLVITPAEVMVGEKVTISVTATNYGTAAGSKRIVCTVS